MEATLAIIAWLGCGIASAGFTYAHFQRSYRIIADEYRVIDTFFAAFNVILGPIALITTLSLGFYRQGWLMPGAKP